MRRRHRRQLQAKRKAAEQQAIDAALAGRFEELDGCLRDITACDRLLAVLPPARWREGLIAAAVGLICVSLIGLAWTLRVPETKLTLTVEGNGAALALAAPWRWSGGLAIDPDPLRLEEFSMLEVPSPDSVSERLVGSPWTEIRGGRATLNRLAAGNGGHLALEVGTGGTLRIYARDAPFSGEMTVQGAAAVAAGSESVRHEVDHLLAPTFPETVRFRADGVGVVPARLVLRPAEAFVLNNLPVRGLSFAREEPDRPGSVVFVSTIERGSLTLSDVARTLELRRGEELSLRGLSGQITEMRVDGKLEVEFRGSAKEIRLGAAGFDRNLVPTLLDYLFHNQKILLIWSALVFLWGMLWSTRKFLFA